LSFEISPQWLPLHQTAHLQDTHSESNLVKGEANKVAITAAADNPTKFNHTGLSVE
jgi:hypothetical protein